MKLERLAEIESKVDSADCSIMSDDELREIVRLARICLEDQIRNKESIIHWVKTARSMGHEVPSVAAKFFEEHAGSAKL